MSKRRAKPAADRSSRYDELLKAAADRHHTVPTDSRAIYEAGVRLLHESMTARMVAGEAIDADAYMKVGEQLQALIPPPAPVKVTIRYVNSLETLCPECSHIFKPPEYSDEICKCPKCGCQFDAESVERMREKKRAAAKVALPPPDATPAPVTPAVVTEGAVAAPTPAARSAPPPSPPPPPPISPTMAAWNRLQGYNRSARDGGLPAVPHVDPNLTAAAPRENYNNAGPLCWVAGTSNRQWRDPVTPDPNPNFNPDGSARGGHPLPYPTHPKK